MSKSLDAVTTPESSLAPKPEEVAPAASPRRLALRRFLGNRFAVAGGILLLGLVLLAVFAPLVAGHNPDSIDLEAISQAPSAQHWLGTDQTGRDVFARVLYGGRVSLSVGAVAVGISLAAGVLFGAIAGYFGGWVDWVVMRGVDIVMTFPAIVILLTTTAIVGTNVYTTMIIIGLLNWPIPCRLIRARFLLLREQEFIQAARTIGASTRRIIVVHALPSTTDVVVVYGSLGIASAILLEAGLSFLGLGVQPPTPSWGNMLNAARDVSVLEQYPWQWLPPGVAIVMTVLATNFVGDGLQDALNPRLKP